MHIKRKTEIEIYNWTSKNQYCFRDFIKEYERAIFEKSEELKFLLKYHHNNDDAINRCRDGLAGLLRIEKDRFKRLEESMIIEELFAAGFKET